MPPAASKKRKAVEKDSDAGAPSTSGEEESKVVYIGWVLPRQFYNLLGNSSLAYIPGCRLFGPEMIRGAWKRGPRVYSA
jgi:hypothetical protein